MMQRFTRIIINGNSMDLDGALLAIGAFEDAPWVDDLRLTFNELMGSDRPITIKTSGTTGEPKEIIFQREELIGSAKLTGEFFRLKEGSKALLCLPARYIAGKMMVVRAMVLGLDLEIVPPHGNVVDRLQRPSPRFAAMIPMQLEKALSGNAQLVEEQFEAILLGGGPVPLHMEECIADLNVNIWHTYGMTETCTHVAARPLTKKAGSTEDEKGLFKAIGATTFSEDDRGCLIVHTRHLQTKKHVTNDMVELMDQTHFTWLGRFDNVVLSGGMKLYPEVLEQRCVALVDRPFFFAGIPDPTLGQRLIGVVEGDALSSAEMADMERSLSRVLGKYEMPKRWSFVDKIVRAANGKIDRRATIRSAIP